MWEKEKDLLCFFSNKGIYIIKIIKLLEDSGVLIDDVTGAVKDEIKTQDSWCFVSTFACFIRITHNFFSGKMYWWEKS